MDKIEGVVDGIVCALIMNMIFGQLNMFVKGFLFVSLVT